MGQYPLLAACFPSFNLIWFLPPGYLGLLLCQQLLLCGSKKYKHRPHCTTPSHAHLSNLLDIQELQPPLHQHRARKTSGCLAINPKSDHNINYKSVPNIVTSVHILLSTPFQYEFVGFFWLISVIELLIILIFMGHLSGCFFYMFGGSIYWRTPGEVSNEGCFYDHMKNFTTLRQGFEHTQMKRNSSPSAHRPLGFCTNSAGITRSR